MYKDGGLLLPQVAGIRRKKRSQRTAEVANQASVGGYVPLSSLVVGPIQMSFGGGNPDFITAPTQGVHYLDDISVEI